MSCAIADTFWSEAWIDVPRATPPRKLCPPAHRIICLQGVAPPGTPDSRSRCHLGVRLLFRLDGLSPKIGA
jgi:hypothetical protein